MTEDPPLPDEIGDALHAQDHADIVIGIPTHNDADTIVQVVTTVRAGLRQFFPDCRSVILNPDARSSDATPERLAEIGSECCPVLRWTVPVYSMQALNVPYHGIPAKGAAIHMILRISHRLRARACVILRPDLLDAAPLWIDHIVRPILDQKFTLVLPYYPRHRYDGGITNGIVRPMVGALYGMRIRQPVNGDYAIGSAQVARYLEEEDVWNTETGRTGIDVWMCTQAVCGGASVGEVCLGERRHPSKDTGSNLSTMLSQVVGAVFEQVNRTAVCWQKIRRCRAIPLLGTVNRVSSEGKLIDVQNLIRTYRLGYDSLRDVWGMVLPPSTLLELRRLAHDHSSSLVFPDRLWARIVFDFALGYRLKTMSRDHLLGALSPLYLAWMSSFVTQVQDVSEVGVERRLEELCRVFETEKPYLISRWRWPDRFSP